MLHKADFTGKVSKNIKNISTFKGALYVFDNYKKIVFCDYEGGMKEKNK